MTSLRLKKSLQNKTFNDIAKEFIIYSKACGRSVWTIKTYEDKFKRFINFLGEDILCKNITDKTIENYKKYLLKTNRETSVNTYLRHIKTLFNYANNKGYMKKINIHSLEAQEKVKKVYSKEDLQELLREEHHESFMKYQTRIMIATFVSTGLRLSELISLQIRDVDFENLVIYSRHTKSRRPRLLPISSSLKILLIEWFSNRKYKKIEDTLFCNSYGEPLKASTLRTAMYRYITKKGIKDTSIHQFRRTFITHAVNNNVDLITLSRLTGHVSLKMLNIYYVNNTEKIVSIADKVSPLEDLNIIPKVRKKLRDGGRR